MTYYKAVQTPEEGGGHGKCIEASKDKGEMEALCRQRRLQVPGFHFTVETVDGELPQSWDDIEEEDRRYR